MKSLNSNIYIVNTKLDKYIELPIFLNAIIRIICIGIYLYTIFKLKIDFMHKINACLNIIDYINNDKKIIIKDATSVSLINKIYIINEILLNMPISHFYADIVII
jgi:hypothetical protein